MMPAHLFDWLIPERLGACVHPAGFPALVAELQAHRIGVLINLHEVPDTPELVERLGVESVHLPVPDFAAPTQAQLATGVAAIEHALERGLRVAVHCAAGLGRTGTLLAAYLVANDVPPADAIARVRAARPGSVETPEQVTAVEEFAAARGRG